MTALELTLLTILIVLYVAMLFMLGVATLRKGHVLFFALGIFFPLFWIIGAVLPPTPTANDLAEGQAEHDRLYTP